MIIKARTPLGARCFIYTPSRDVPRFYDEALMIREDGVVTNAFEVDTNACTLKVYLFERQPDGSYRARWSPWTLSENGERRRELLTGVVKMSYDVVDRANGQIIARARL